MPYYPDMDQSPGPEILYQGLHPCQNELLAEEAGVEEPEGRALKILQMCNPGLQFKTQPVIFR